MVQSVDDAVGKVLGALDAEGIAGQSEPGSGSAPGIYLDTYVVRVTHADLSAGALAARLRAGEPPVFVRIQDDAVLLDPRTLLPGLRRTRQSLTR